MKLLRILGMCTVFLTAQSMQKTQTLEQRVTELEKNLERVTLIIANQNEVIKAMNNGQITEIEKTIKSITQQQEDIEQKLGNFKV